MEQPPIQYARTSDGVRLAYQDFGSGPPFVFAAACPFSHVQLELEIPQVARWWLEQARANRIIRYDGRGNGLSDRAATDFSVEAQVRDLEAVVDHLGVERFALLGAWIGSPAAIAFTALHPSRVSHLILWHGYARAAELYEASFNAMRSMAELDWDLFLQTAAHATIGWEQADLARAYAAVFRAAVDRRTLMDDLTLFSAPDVTPHLAQIRVPTLVLARRDVRASGADLARTLAAQIPNARLMILEGSSPVPYDGDDAMTATREFLALDSPPVISPQFAEPPPHAALTPRETEVLSLLAGGRTGKEIAAELTVSLSTVQRHIANIYTKIGARGRVDAAAYALSHGLVRPRDP